MGVGGASFSLWIPTSELDLLHEQLAHATQRAVEAEGVLCIQVKILVLSSLCLRLIAYLRRYTWQEKETEEALAQAAQKEARIAELENELWRHPDDGSSRDAVELKITLQLEREDRERERAEKERDAERERANRLTEREE